MWVWWGVSKDLELLDMSYISALIGPYSGVTVYLGPQIHSQPLHSLTNDTIL